MPGAAGSSGGVQAGLVLEPNLLPLLHVWLHQLEAPHRPRAALSTHPKKRCDLPEWRAEERLTHY